MVLVAAKSLESPLSTTVTFAGYYCARSAYVCLANFFAWYDNATRFDEPMSRAIVFPSMNLGANSVIAWYSFYGASMAP